MATVTPPTVPAVTSAKQEFLTIYAREFPTTLKILNAYPKDAAELRPHPRAKTARELAWIFVVEQGVLAAALTDTLDMSKGFPPVPATLDEIISAYQAGHDRMLGILEGMTDEGMRATTTFMTGPKQMGPVPKIDIAWMMLMDSVHHRGQLSVYLRMSGGRVPSIYGPSADEPWL